MRISRASGALLLGSVVAFSFLGGCQTTPTGGPEPLTVEEVVQEPLDLGEEADAVEPPSGKELRELEEEIQQRSGTDPSRDRRTRSLEAQADAFGAELEFDAATKQWSLSRDGRVLTVKQESRVARLDGVVVFLDAPVTRVRGRWALSESDARILLEAAFGQVPEETRPIRTVVIDPGHGGSETGTKNESLGILEKDLNLDVSQRLQVKLEELGFRAVLTRYDDRLVPLEQRASIANGVKADLFVSVHFNAALNREAKGLETYLLTPAGQASTSGSGTGDEALLFPGNRFDLENFELAFRIQKAMLDRLGREDRGVKKARFQVLKLLDCPGALVECGFVSNREESLLISTPGYRERVALALAEAIAAYAGTAAAPSS